ncbi:nitroreductase family protein [Pseudomonas sp. RL_5y_Pfl2_73]|uniref:nitroreductase family protein n=1 Tax=Pseudomonas sp. RL_5y_Pfl2_73 TaxID=3088713 RepID=UPI0030D8E004
MTHSSAATCRMPTSTTRTNGSRLISSAGARWVGTSMGCLASPRGKSNVCTNSTGAMTVSSTHLWACCSPWTRCWMDDGMFLQSVMLAARGRGLHTCPQAAFLKDHNVISEILNIPADQMLACGMSLGYADPTAIENTLVTAREPVSAFAVFHHNK